MLKFGPMIDNQYAVNYQRKPYMQPKEVIKLPNFNPTNGELCPNQVKFEPKSKFDLGFWVN